MSAWRRAHSAALVRAWSTLATHSSPHALWDWRRRFDKGEGFRVKDEAGANDLVMSGEPHWVVVPWLAMCGDGWVQGLEECDDGDTKDGDGCSHNVSRAPSAAPLECLFRAISEAAPASLHLLSPLEMPHRHITAPTLLMSHAA